MNTSAVTISQKLNEAMDIVAPLLIESVEAWLAPTVEWVLKGQRSMIAQEPLLVYEALCNHPASYDVSVPYRYYQLLEEVVEAIASGGGTVSDCHTALLPYVLAGTPNRGI